MNKPLYLIPILYRHISHLILILKITNALEVFLKLNPRKYKYKEYISITVDVLFLSNLICILIRNSRFTAIIRKDPLLIRIFYFVIII